MRNLKRALSLALASVMLLGMMVVGTSAASYTDVDEKDNVEAIEVLNAVNVMIGRQGNFEPDEAVNRHEMAVIMAKLVLGVETADSYVGSHPFTDVVPWADKYVAACYENGLIAGTSATTYGGSQPLTAVQAAAMMLRALGYKDLSKGATDWRAPVTAMANQIRLFSGVASNPSERLDRNQVAQLALNTLKSPVVDLKDNTFDIADGNGAVIITGGSREYIVRSSSESYARAINRTEYQGTSASSVGGWTIELGEHLYNGKLRLEDTTDVFGRPARQWEYDGKEIGTYAKEELLRREYTAKVTGRDLYDLLGKTTIDEYDFTITVDGETEADTLKKGDNAYFTEGNLVRTNTNAIGATDKGVLTQVFVDSGEKDVYIAIINTYLAKASKDYDTKKEEATFTVYGVEDIESGSAITLVKRTTNKSTSTPYTESLKVRNEDIVVENVKEDDFFLVNVAEGEIKTMVKPEILSEETINAFKKGSWVNNGSQIDYADTAKYDPEVLDAWNDKNMKDLTYNIFLDKYGYLIGLEQNSDPDQYVFITGRQAGSNDLGDANADMRAIFLDGTVKVIEVNVKDSSITSGGAIANTWCKYSVDKNGTYTLTEIANKLDATKKVKVAQWAQNANGVTGGYTIDKGHVSLKASSNGTAADTRVYGNDDTVYLGVSLRTIANASSATQSTTTAANNTGADKDKMSTKWWSTANSDTTKYAAIIDDVDSVTVGVKNVSLKAKDVLHVDVVEDTTVTTDVIIPVHEVYTLYKDNGYVIAAVVIGEDEGTNANYAYITGSDYNSERYDSANDEWTWTLEAVVDGKIVDLREVGSTIKYLNKMVQGSWYEVRYDADGNVRGIKNNGGVDGAVAFANTNPTNANDDGKFIVEVLDVELSLENRDTVLMQANYATAKGLLTYKNGTLYTDKAKTQGFSVSPDVKTVVSLSKLKADGTPAPFDSVEDGYDGYSGLEDAITDLDDNFKGYLNVLFKDDVATVIILDDRTGTKVDEGSDPTPAAGKYSSVVDTKITTGLSELDFSDTGKFAISETTGVISKFNAVAGESLQTQIKDYLRYKGFTIAADASLSRNADNDGYEIPVTDSDGIKMTASIADTVLANKITFVTLDKKSGYLTSTQAASMNAAATALSVTPTGTAVKASSDGSYQLLTAAPKANETYVSGYVDVNVTVTGTATNADGGTLSVTAGGTQYVEVSKAATVKATVTSTKAAINTGVKLTGDNTAANTATIAKDATSVTIDIALSATETANTVNVELTATNAT